MLCFGYKNASAVFYFPQTLWKSFKHIVFILLHAAIEFHMSLEKCMKMTDFSSDGTYLIVTYGRVVSEKTERMGKSRNQIKWILLIVISV